MNVLKYFLDYLKYDDSTIPKILTIEETINQITEKHMSIARFGDGEIDLLLHTNQPKFQKSTPILTKRLEEVLNTPLPSLLLCIPKVFTKADRSILTSKAAHHWKKFIVYNRQGIYSLLNPNTTFGNALVTRQYIDLKNKNNSINYFKKIKKIWDNKNIVIIEGNYTRFGVNNDLLSNASSIRRILCPPTNSFDVYNVILQTALQCKNVDLFLIALGPTATILAYDLAKNNYQALDIGHLDIEYEWHLAGSTKKEAIAHKYVNEANGIINPSNDDFKDILYEKQIIATIHNNK